MKSYKEVVKERYDGVEKEIHPHASIYSVLNPVGSYGDQIIRKTFLHCFNVIRKRGADLTQMKILDIGCGRGTTTRFFSEITGDPELVFGMDLSKSRVENAINMNPKITYCIGDILALPNLPAPFDVVTTLDMFMHLECKQDLLLGLENIKSILSDDGYFIWYDVYSKDHFQTTADQDHSGFHPKQMIDLAKQAGFKVIMRKNVFKRIMWKYHSVYLVKKFPRSFIMLLEKLMPGSPGNMVMIFTKIK